MKPQNIQAEMAKANKRRGRVVDLPGLAEITGYHGSTLRRFIQDGMPVESGEGRNRRFDTAKVIWWLEYRHLTQEEAGVLDARERRTLAQAELLEIELARKRGEVADLAEVEMAITRAFSDCRARLLALPTKWAPQLKGLEEGQLQALLDQGIEEALYELTTVDPAGFCPEAVLPGVEAAAEAADLGVGGQTPEAEPEG